MATKKPSGEKLSDRDLQRVNELIAKDPVLQQYAKQEMALRDRLRAAGKSSWDLRGDNEYGAEARKLNMAKERRLNELGFDTGDGLVWTRDKTTGLYGIKNDKSFLQAAWPVLVAMGGVTAAGLLAGGAAATGGGGYVAGASNAATAAGTAGAGAAGTAATTAATTAGTTAATAAAGGGFLNNLMKIAPFVLTGFDVFSDIYAQKKANEANKEAIEALERAAERALAIQKAMYEQTRTDTAPWRNVGGQAVNSLGYLMGLPAGPVSGPNADAGPLVPSLQQAMSQESLTTPRTGTRPRPSDVPPTGSAVPRPNTQSFSETMASRPLTTPQQAAQAETQSGYVNMRAPDGTVQPVDVRDVEMYRSQGAQLV